jgi:hypothetical protein
MTENDKILSLLMNIEANQRKALVLLLLLVYVLLKYRIL